MASRTHILYSVNIDRFALSDSADGPKSDVSWNEVAVDKFLRISVTADMPETVTALRGRYRKLTENGKDKSGAFVDLGEGKRVALGSFEFTIIHYTLEPETAYLIQVADDFTQDTQCLATNSIRTVK